MERIFSWNNAPGVVSLEKDGEVLFTLQDTLQGEESEIYQFTSLPAGDYTITSVPSGGYVKERQSVTLSAGQNMTDVSFGLCEETGSISGNVTDGVNPVESVWVQAYSGTYYGYGVTDENGDYEISPLGAGTYEVTTMCGGYIDETASSITVTQNQETTDVDFELEEE